MTCKYFRTIQLYQDDETEDIETDLGDNEDVSQLENEDESLRLQPYSGTRRIVPIRKKVKRNNNRFYDNLNPSSQFNPQPVPFLKKGKCLGHSGFSGVMSKGHHSN